MVISRVKVLVHLKNLILAGVNLMDGHIASVPATNFMLVVGIEGLHLLYF